MNADVDDMPDCIHRLAIRQIAGELTDRERAELIALLTDSAQARRVYLEHMQDTVSLRWILSGHCDRKTALELAERRLENVRGSRRRTIAWVALALAAGLAAVAALPYWRTSSRLAQSSEDAPAAASDRVATVTALNSVTWDGPSATARLSRVGIGQKFDFTRGAVALAFDTGAEVKVFGPAKFEILSPKSILCSRGRVTTQVEESGKGFTIETPKARIVDLGTEFGVDISTTGDTQVVVFEGSVDLKKSPKSTDAGSGADGWSRRLQQGDALLLGDDGEQRVMAVQRGDFFPPNLFDDYGRRRRAPVILDVKDNIRALESTKCYQIVWGGLREDAPCFVDRDHQWNGKEGGGLPEFLLGADYIMPFNDDKFLPDLRVDVTVARPATCYVFLDDNMTPPEWLRKEFKDTGFDIALDGAKTQWHKDHDLGVGPGQSIDFPFSVWSRDLPKPGVVTLGGVQPPKEKRSHGFNMYGIAIVPK